MARRQPRADLRVRVVNLGQALNRSGRAREAIPYLEKRLTWDDQIDKVQAEARRRAPQRRLGLATRARAAGRGCAARRRGGNRSPWVSRMRSTTVPWTRSVASSRSRSGRSCAALHSARATVRSASRTGSITSLMKAACSSGSLTASLISLGAMRGRAVRRDARHLTALEGREVAGERSGVLRRAWRPKLSNRLDHELELRWPAPVDRRLADAGPLGDSLDGERW